MACPSDMECPIDMENCSSDELLHFAMYGEAPVLPNNDPLKVTYLNQALPAGKQCTVPTAETDGKLLVGKKELSKLPLTLNRLPEHLAQDAKDDKLPIYLRSYILNFDWASRFPGEEYQDYEKYLEVDENRPTARTCGLLTMVIFKLLVYLEGYLKLILEKTKSDASAVHSKLLELESLEDLVGPKKRSWMNMYGIPYFKDDRYFPCPVNKDGHNKKQNNELLVVELQQFCDWNANDTDKLEKAIAKEEIMKRRLELSKALDTTKDSQKKAELKWKLKAIPSLKQIDKMTSVKEFCEDVEWEYDWLKIAAQSFQGLKHPDECRSAWHVCLHPKINRSTWSDEENERLKELAKDYNYQDWDAIAQELGTNRTPFVVMQHFQRHLNEDFINKTWTKEEDDLLAQLVKSCRCGSRISWKEIAQQLKGHTKRQILKRWTYYVNPNLRPFTKSEDMLLVAAVRSYGENYSKLLELFPYRSCDQLHSRYRVLTTLNQNPLDESEIEKLLALVTQFGERRWKEISEYFSDRTPASLKEEYATFKERMQGFADSNHNLSETDYIEETVCEEQKLWRKVKQVHPDLTEYGRLDINGLSELKGMLIKEKRMLPQNIRKTSPFDKECNTYFKCVAHPDALYENDLYENKKRLEKPEVLKYILHLLHAKLQTPNESLFSNHPLLKVRDWYLLQELSEESFMVSEERQEPADKVHLKYCLPPNFVTLCGFCSIMLHREYVLDEQDQEKEEKEEKMSEQAVQADCLFKERFRFLFLWPALTTAEPPALRQPPPVEDSVVYSSDYMLPRKRKRRPTRTELLNIFGPKKKQKYTRSKLKQESVVNIEKDASGPSEAATPSTSSCVDNINNSAVIEIRDESIYQTLLASEKNKKMQTNTTTRSLCSSSEEHDKLQRNTAFTITSSTCSSSSEKNKNTTIRSLCSSSKENDKLQRNTAFTITSSPGSSSSEKNKNTTIRSLCSSSKENDKLQRNTAFTTTSSPGSSSSEKNENTTIRSLCSSKENDKLQRNTAFTITSSPGSSSSDKNKKKTTTKSLSSLSEENDKLQRNTAFTITSSPSSSSSEKKQTNTLLTCADLSSSSTSGKSKRQQADVPLSLSGETFSFKNVKCLRTYSRVKKPKT